MGTTSSTSTLYFTGLSTFSSDFQQIIQRSVSIAQLPVTALQNQVTANNDKNTTLETLNPSVAALGSDVAAIGALASNLGLNASSSNSSLVAVTNMGATKSGAFTISDITSLATAASETSIAGYTTTQAVSSTGHLNLVVGTKTYSLDLTGANQNDIGGLENAINNSGAPVNATILANGSQNYLVVSANSTGATTLQLNDVPASAVLVTNGGTGTETSVNTQADTDTTAVSNTGKLNLVVGSTTYNLDISANNNLNGLAQAINNAGTGVTATVTGSAGNYSLSIAASGPTTIQLYDQAPLISQTNQGTNADFFLNGIHINDSTNTYPGKIPGLSFTLKGETTGAVTLSLASDSSQLSSALQSMVTHFNTLVGQVQSQQGSSAGPLQGDLLINQIQGDMQQLVTYWNPASSSSIRSLSDFGVSFNDNGQMSFDPSVIAGFSDKQLSDAFKFLGSSTTGFGALASNFSQLSDPISGLIANAENGLTRENNSLSDQITTLNARVASVQAATTAQAQQADAFVAQLQSQQNALDASIQSLNLVLFGRQTNSNGL
jgi:flagellar hook-associated protein 2